MKIFAPLMMIEAVKEIEQQHPLSAAVSIPVSSDSFRKLVLRINQKEVGKLKGLAASISKRQVYALCLYMATNAYQVDLEKISEVIRYRMCPEVYLLTYEQWNRAPECLRYLTLLSEFDREEYRTDVFPVQQGLFEKWSHAAWPILAVAQTVKDLGVGYKFNSKFISLGLKEKTALADQCFWEYLSTARKKQFEEEGDQAIAESLAKARRDIQTKVLCRLLDCAERQPSVLIPFRALYQIALALWGEPNSKTFPESSCFHTYTWWYNYNQLVQALHGDRRRVEYWRRHLDICTCSRVTAHQMLVMRFEHRVVTEFEEQGAVYIFEKEYFDAVVWPYMNHHRTQPLKSWLFHEADSLSREVHTQRWESKQEAELRRCGVL